VTEIAQARGNAVVVVASKVTDPSDIDLVQEIVGRPVAVAVPADEAVAETDRRGVALIDHAPESPALRAIESLVDGLVEGTMKGIGDR
jgi:CO dehydrogenase nickel-insertion accessory protein CooC1